MHIPDGFLDGKTVATTTALAVTGVALALRQVRRELPPRKTTLLGLGASFLFAAQMLNFPVAGGTSGHLMGGVLVAALLGPAAGAVVLTTVLIVQCFLFADGGVSALGANIFNMALVATLGGRAIYRAVSRWLPGLRGQVTAVAFAGWSSMVLAAVACAAQLAWSGTVAWSVGFPAMAGIHMLIGLGEGLISALVFLAIARTRPDLVTDFGSNLPRPPRGNLVALGLVVSLGLAMLVAPFASPWPDGLESVAARLGFAEHARAPLLPAPIPDYELPGIGSPVMAVALAGAVGTLVVFGLALGLSRWLVPRDARTRPASESP